MPLDEMLAKRPKGIIFSGGPASVHVDGAPSIDAAIYDAGVPVLGICYGAQLLALQLGGKVERTGGGEYGRTSVTRSGTSVLLTALADEQQVWMSHGDAITLAPEGFVVTASSPGAPVAALEDRDRALYGVQFHPEVAHTERGQEILRSFLFDVADCRPTWTNTNIIDEAVEEIRAQVGDERVMCGLSGGVDSAVAAAIVHRAVGDQLTCVFVDTGLLRLGEPDQVEETFRRQFHVDLVHVKATDRFLSALGGVTEPEAKRKVIGETFIRVFEEVAGDFCGRALPRAGHALPRHRRVGRRRQRHDQVAPQRGRPPGRHEVRAGRAAAPPVQGRGARRRRGARAARGDRVAPAVPRPGLGVRIIGEVTPERLDTLRQADHVVLEELRARGPRARDLAELRRAARGADGRCDGRRAHVRVPGRGPRGHVRGRHDRRLGAAPHDVLERIASRIINEVPGVNRVAYDITSKPPGTIEWE